MTPAARISAAITILDRVLGGEPAEAALIRWSRASRYAGSGDRAAVRDLVFDSLRRLRSRATLGGAMTGRGVLLGACREAGRDPAEIFSGEGHAPAVLTEAELALGRAPAGAEALDLPDWMLGEWQASLGDQAEAVAEAMRTRAPVWLRVNPRKADPKAAQAALAAEGILTETSPLLETALEVREGSRKLANAQAYREGLVELQDLSPQLACAALPLTGSVLDFCAGGGGKALALAGRGAASVSAHDIDRARMANLPERARRAGGTIRLVPPGKAAGRFDLVVADVPCSGSGTWRRTPDQKWRLTEADLERLGGLQTQILDQSAEVVAAEGHLAYMTCSVFARENQDQVQAFLSRNSGFVLEKVTEYSPLTASDGFFCAILRRN
ncbi:RsmB/NOP family class I SAM-dependent RNA methyltransferase [Paracoccus aminophilus]|uniref:Ribosomal RNA small subunit methyltransferase B n=1 Tax=Paracoccus aminophilus JCM 7686 TaxID=1367847 RepID=S5YDT2_PARAH|nr:RsmB/NOP family class I SAM-dependent RNA methyltransferase [Paracoccus aminophilus]AGT09608.1 ribosomal RNA small subunit methyltransferase B [Paracoccus aminophilus JCM 7686]